MGDSTEEIALSQESIDLLVKKFKKEINSGTSALILLGILNNANKALYGYEISKLLEQNASEKQGAIYPVLRNMVNKGLLDVEMLPSDTGPARKYFNISPLGKAVLNEWINVWQQTKSLVEESLFNDLQQSTDLQQSNDIKRSSNDE